MSRLCKDSLRNLIDADEEHLGANLILHKDQLKKNESAFINVISGDPIDLDTKFKYWMYDKDVETDLTSNGLLEMSTQIVALERQQKELKLYDIYSNSMGVCNTTAPNDKQEKAQYEAHSLMEIFERDDSISSKNK